MKVGGGHGTDGPARRGAGASVRECAAHFTRIQQCPKTPSRLIWIDMEMTGLKPDTDRIIEVALVVTDGDLNTVAEAPVWVVHQERRGAGRHGLVEPGHARPLGPHRQGEGVDAGPRPRVEAQALAFLREHVPAKASPMCGNSICQDRRFLARWMPALEDYFHYRNLDVSTLKELARRWKPDLMKGIPKEGKHEALADVYESIAELKYYRENFIRAVAARGRSISACARASRRRRSLSEARVDARIVARSSR